MEESDEDELDSDDVDSESTDGEDTYSEGYQLEQVLTAFHIHYQRAIIFKLLYYYSPKCKQLLMSAVMITPQECDTRAQERGGWHEKAKGR